MIANSSIVTPASPHAVWKVWTDVKNWFSWDPDVDSCEIKGEFREGAKAVLKPASGPRVNIEIVQSVAMKSFIRKSFLPFCSLVFEKNERDRWWNKDYPFVQS